MESATAGVISFPGQIMINPDPTGSHNFLIGLGSAFFNELIDGMKLNVTLIASNSLGSCSLLNSKSSNIICSGLIDLIVSNTTAFSIFALPMRAYDHRIMFAPVLFGP
jgi:hypothetical protein